MDCPHIPVIGMSDFKSRLRQQLTGARIPLSGSLELSYRCNLRCQHCYVAHGHTGIPGKRELALVEIQRILDEVVEAGCVWLLLTGGEPLLRPDFKEIYSYAKRKGMLVTLFTNGTLITPRLADFLAEWRPINIEITLYGNTQATYERVTGMPGAHAQVRRGIELLLERGLPLKLKTMLMTLNVQELEAMRAYAASLGLPFRYDAQLNAGLDGSGKPRQLRLDPRQVVEIDRNDPRRLQDLARFNERILNNHPDGQQLYVCAAGLYSFHIDPYGELSLCMMARQTGYNLRNFSFHQGWSQFLTQERNLKPHGRYECGECQLMPICGQCPGWSQIEHGNRQTRVDYLCQVAHLRAAAFGLLDQPLLAGSNRNFSSQELFYAEQSGR